MILTKKTIEREHRLKARLSWMADPAAFTGGGATVATTAHPLGPKIDGIGFIPSVTLDLGKDGKLYLSPAEVLGILEAAKKGQASVFVGREASEIVKAPEPTPEER